MTTTFFDWLTLQNGRGDPVGLLADVAMNQDQLLSRLPALCDWRERILTLIAATHHHQLQTTGRDEQPPDLLGALAAAWEEYNGGRRACFGCGGKRGEIRKDRPQITGLCRKCSRARSKHFHSRFARSLKGGGV